MIDYNKLVRLYQSVINGETITKSMLYQLRLSDMDIISLLEKNILVKEDDNVYQFKDIDSLCKYGLKCHKKGNTDLAKSIFTKCIEINPNFDAAYLSLFLLAVKEKRYEEAFTYFDSCYQDASSFIKQDLNLYLILLDNIIILPINYRLILNDMDPSQVQVLPRDKRYQAKTPENEYRMMIMHNKYELCLKNKKYYMNTDEVNAEIIKVLLTKICDEITISFKNMMDALDTMDEKKINSLKHNLIDRVNLGETELYALKVIDAIMDIKKTKEIPAYQCDMPQNTYDAIDRGDYYHARILQCCYLNKMRLGTQNNILLKLLKRINEEIRNAVKEREMKTPLNSIEYHLKHNQVNDIAPLISNYCEQTGYGQYASLINNLIKLCSLHEDSSYAEPLSILRKISRNCYWFDIESYMNRCHDALMFNDISKSLILLTIIEEYFGEYKDNPYLINKYKILWELRQQRLQEQVMDNISKLKTNGIGIIRVLDAKETAFVENLVVNVPDIYSFSYDNRGEPVIILKYNPPMEERINFNAIFKTANKLFGGYRCQEAIELYHKLCYPYYGECLGKSLVYAKIGYSYIKTERYDLALQYFKVANILAGEEKLSYNYDEIIDSIYKQGNEDKPYTKKRQI